MTKIVSVMLKKWEIWNNTSK